MPTNKVADHQNTVEQQPNPVANITNAVAHPIYAVEKQSNQVAQASHAVAPPFHAVATLSHAVNNHTTSNLHKPNKKHYSTETNKQSFTQ